MNKIKHRFESFGGIISSNCPPVLAYVDREYMVNAGFGTSPRWKESRDNDAGCLSAPVEAHVSLTNQCPVECTHCYNSSRKEVDPESEPTTEELLNTMRILKHMNVFHIALAGGEILLRKDFFEIYDFLTSSGYMPNLTLSGIIINEEIASKLRSSGQINVSIDGVGDYFSVFRKSELFRHADRALDILKKHHVNTGINCLLNCKNASGLDSLFEYAKKKNVNEIAFLRLKPAGRSRENYLQNKLTDTQCREMPQVIKKLSKKYNISAKFDCSLVPFVCYSGKSLREFDHFLIRGCEAGNYLISISPKGDVSGCGFIKSNGLNISNLKEEWNQDETLNELRGGHQQFKEPCCSCRYLEICRGGCKAVSEYYTGSLYNPDPECPYVVDYNKI